MAALCVCVYMAREFAKEFYNSRAWKDCRRAYAAKVGGLCERCLAKGIYKPGVVVHHKTHLTPENITDPWVALSFDNLELLCMDCHAAEHSNKKYRYTVDALGKITAID